MIKLSFMIIFVAQFLFGQPINPLGDNSSIKYLNIPKRQATAAGGAAFASMISNLSLEEREKAVVKEILNGNVPTFSRKLKPLTIKKTINSKTYELIFYTVCDYMAIGSDEDYLYIPMTPSTAQYIANVLKCSLPTKKMVDLIYNNAEIKLYPQPIPPSDKMVTVPVFKQHTDSIKFQISQIGFNRLADSIIAGHKKDIIISNKIYSNDRNYERVVIYGWHLGINNPIQPVYNGHIASYADYSHGVRLISEVVWLNGDSVQIGTILKDTQLSALLSDEGSIKKPYYPPSNIFTSLKIGSNIPINNFDLQQNYPNPFNPTTTIKYTIPSMFSTTVMQNITVGAQNFTSLQLIVYDILGREVATLVNKKQLPGNYSVTFNAKNLPSGIYLYRLKAKNIEMSRKMLLVR